MLKKIIFMGTPLFAVPILKSLYQNGYPIEVVYTQPPKKSKRVHQFSLWELFLNSSIFNDKKLGLSWMS